VDAATVELALPPAMGVDQASSGDRHGPLAEQVMQFEREAILAARKERKEKGKADVRGDTQPRQTRYRKRRIVTAATETIEPEIDPLDAQRAGLHDEALEQGHEEIKLNLEETE